MNPVLKALEGPIPRPLLWIGVPISGILLILFFLFMTFPYELLIPLLNRGMSQTGGGNIAIGAIEPRFGLSGPGLAAVDLQFALGNGDPLHIDRLEVHPAFSSDWLRGHPALNVDLETALGRAQGLLSLGPAKGWAGEIEVQELADLPIPLPEGLALEGAVTSSMDLSLTPESLTGAIHFEARDGSLSLSAIPIPLEFSTLRGDFELGGEAWLEVRELDLQGPTLSASARGSILQSQPPGEQQMDLEVQVVVENPVLRGMVQGMGVRLDDNGRATLALTGTPKNPRFN